MEMKNGAVSRLGGRFQFSPPILTFGPLEEIVIRPLHCGAFYTKVLGL